MDRLVIAPQPLDRCAACGQTGCFAEQPVRLAELAEVGALECGVDEEFGAVDRLFGSGCGRLGLALVERFPDLAGIVATLPRARLL